MAKRPSHNLEKQSNLSDLLRSKVDQSIVYQTLPSRENLSRNTQHDTPDEIIGHEKTGTVAASVGEFMRADSLNDDRKIDIISNAARIEMPDEAEFPDKFEFEIYRLRARVVELECVVRDKDARISTAIAMLEDEALMWRTVMFDHVKETFGRIKRRMGKIESTLSDLKDIQPHVYPKLEIPARWRKDK